MTEVFVVTKNGYHMQGVVGVYSTEALADGGARLAATFEKDGYHEFHCHRCTLDAVSLFGRGSGIDTNAGLVFVFRSVLSWPRVPTSWEMVRTG